MRVKLVVIIFGLISTIGIFINNSYREINHHFPTVTIKKEVTLAHNYTNIQKWRQYKDYETLQLQLSTDVYSPTQLPAGFSLESVAYSNDVIRGVYKSNRSSLTFYQSQAPIQLQHEEKLDGINTEYSWKNKGYYFKLIGTHIELEQLKQFSSSLSFRTVKETTTPLPFQIMTCAQDKIVEKARHFTVYTVTQYKEQAIKYCKDNDIIFENENDIIIGLYAGEKGSSGYTINTASVVLNEDTLFVYYYEIEPFEDKAYLTVHTFPYQYIYVNLPTDYQINAVQFNTIYNEAITNIKLK